MLQEYQLVAVVKAARRVHRPGLIQSPVRHTHWHHPYLMTPKSSNQARIYVLATASDEVFNGITSGDRDIIHVN